MREHRSAQRQGVVRGESNTCGAAARALGIMHTYSLSMASIAAARCTQTNRTTQQLPHELTIASSRQRSNPYTLHAHTPAGTRARRRAARRRSADCGWARQPRHARMWRAAPESRGRGSRSQTPVPPRTADGSPVRPRARAKPKQPRMTEPLHGHIRGRLLCGDGWRPMHHNIAEPPPEFTYRHIARSCRRRRQCDDVGSGLRRARGSSARGGRAALRQRGCVQHHLTRCRLSHRALGNSQIQTRSKRDTRRQTFSGCAVWNATYRRCRLRHCSASRGDVVCLPAAHAFGRGEI